MTLILLLDYTEFYSFVSTQYLNYIDEINQAGSPKGTQFSHVC